MNLTFSRATEHDIVPLAELVDALIEYHKGIDPIYSSRMDKGAIGESLKKEIVDSDILLWCARERGTIIGFIRGMRQERKDRSKDIALLQDIFVLPEFRKRGIAQNLLESFESWAKQKGIQRIELQVDIRNLDAVGFWDKAGFKDYQVRKAKELG